MNKFHAIGGLPRSGSTLLCNLLNQNPKFHASSTSPICQLVNVISNTVSNSAEFKSDIKAKTDGRVVDATRAFIGNWYKGKDVVFDKGRGWGHNNPLFSQLFPEGRMIICVRDLRNVFSSIEKQHTKNPILDYANSPQEKTVFTRADQMFSPQGMIGFPIQGIEDILRRNPKNVTIIQYEQLVKSPSLVLERIYADLGEKYFEHNFKSVENTATDLDELYLNKFPHEGKGAVQDTDPEEYKKYVPQDVAGLIMERYKGFNKAFGYGQ